MAKAAGIAGEHADLVFSPRPTVPEHWRPTPTEWRPSSRTPSHRSPAHRRSSQALRPYSRAQGRADAPLTRNSVPEAAGSGKGVRNRPPPRSSNPSCVPHRTRARRLRRRQKTASPIAPALVRYDPSTQRALTSSGMTKRFRYRTKSSSPIPSSSRPSNSRGRPSRQMARAGCSDRVGMSSPAGTIGRPRDFLTQRLG